MEMMILSGVFAILALGFLILLRQLEGKDLKEKLKADLVTAKERDKILDIIVSKYIKLFEDTSKDIEKSLQEKFVEREIKIGGEVEARTAKMVAGLEQEIAQEKARRLEKLEEDIKVLAEDVMVKILGKKLTETESEKLVMEALREAEKERFF